MNQINATMASKPKNPPTTPPIMRAIGVEPVLLLLFVFGTVVGTGTGGWVAVVVMVCTNTDPLACVEVDSLVMTVGGGVVHSVVNWVVNWEVDRVVTIGTVDMVVHEEPNNVMTPLLVIGTVKVRGTCTVAVTAGMTLVDVMNVVTQLLEDRAGTQLAVTTIVVDGGVVVTESVDVVSRLCVTTWLVCVKVGEDVHDTDIIAAVGAP